MLKSSKRVYLFILLVLMAMTFLACKPQEAAEDLQATEVVPAEEGQAARSETEAVKESAEESQAATLETEAAKLAAVFFKEVKAPKEKNDKDPLTAYDIAGEPITLKEPLKILEGEYFFEKGVDQNHFFGQEGYHVYSAFAEKERDESFEVYGLEQLMEPTPHWTPEQTNVKRPRGIAARSEDLVVSDEQEHRLYRLSPTGETLEVVGSLGMGEGEFNKPVALLWQEDEQALYVLENGNKRIQVLDADLKHLRSIPLPDVKGDLGFASMAMGPAGKIFVATSFSDLYTDGVYEIDSETGEANPLGHLLGLVFSLGDEVYAAQNSSVLFTIPDSIESSTGGYYQHVYRLTEGKRELLWRLPGRMQIRALFGHGEEVLFIDGMETLASFVITDEGFQFKRTISHKLSHETGQLSRFPNLSMTVLDEKVYVASAEDGMIYIVDLKAD